MEIDYYAKYFAFEHDDWWFVARRHILFSLLADRLGQTSEPLRVLDVGCGTGINLGYLGNFGQVTGLDSEPTALSFCKMRGKTRLINARMEHLPFPDGTFDLVTALDVLEHLEEDAPAAHELVRMVKPGGWLLVTVPAFQSLWSDHDLINHHKRRYRIAELKRLFGEKVVLEKASYYNTFLLPLAVLIRLTKKITLRLRPEALREIKAENTYLPRSINTLFRKIFSAELAWLRKGRLPVGLSIVLLARKAEEPLYPAE
jgi:SAM-dependent methyltransferase